MLEVPAPEDKPKSGSEPDSDPLANVKRAKQASFDFKPFLPHLPIFEGFDAAEIAEVVSASSVLELPRGHDVFVHGQPSTACFIVVRGAVEIRAQHEKRERRMAVLGPGQLLGYMSALEKSVHGSDAVVREQALLLEIPSKDFEKLYFGSSPGFDQAASRHPEKPAFLARPDQPPSHAADQPGAAARRGQGRRRAGSRSQRADRRRRPR